VSLAGMRREKGPNDGGWRRVREGGSFSFSAASREHPKVTSWFPHGAPSSIGTGGEAGGVRSGNCRLAEISPLSSPEATALVI